MNRKEAAELLPFIKAFGEGKDIEMRSKNPRAQLNGWAKMDEFIFGNFEYRIKPEPKCHPFANAEECWTEMQKHQPFGWVKDKQDGHRVLITAVNDDTCGMSLNGNAGWSLQGIKGSFTFADGTPFGVKVEE